MAAVTGYSNTGEWSESGSLSKKAEEEALEAFYKEQAAADLQRKVTRSKSQLNKPAGARAFFTRRTNSRKDGSQIAESSSSARARLSSASTVSRTEEKRGSVASSLGGPSDRDDESSERPASGPLLASIVPDTLAEAEIPSWLQKESESVQHVNTYRVKHPLNNPSGPQWYQNVHLLPPSILKTGSRPPSFFSPQFPPMAASTGDRSLEGAYRPAGQRGSPSASPTSSQLGFGEPGRRSRKTSQTAQDQVDLLDISDPTGAQWHHTSPYDSGMSSAVSPPPLQDHPEGSSSHSVSTSSSATSPPARSRRGSFTIPRKIAPSPLSQSTSALHLAPSDTHSVSLPRRSSKIRSSIMNGFTIGSVPRQTSEPPTASKSMLATAEGLAKAPALGDSASPSSSPVTPIVLTPTSSTASQPPTPEKKEKRGSVLGRFARRLSTIKKPTMLDFNGTPTVRPDQRQAVNLDDSPPSETPPPLASAIEPSTPPLDHTLPAIAMMTSMDDQNSEKSVLIEPPRIGRLHIVNPDDSPLSSPVLEKALPLPVDEDPPLTLPPPLPLPSPPPSQSETETPRDSHQIPAALLDTPKQVPVVALSSTSSNAGATIASNASAYAESPMSILSTLANPPTPQNNADQIAPLVPSKPKKLSVARKAPAVEKEKVPESRKVSTAKPAQIEKEKQPVSRVVSVEKEPPKVRPQAARSPSANSITRQTTETYKLVKQSSDEPASRNGVLSAGGEQWKIVGAPETTSSRPQSSSHRPSRSRDDRHSGSGRSSPEKRSSKDLRPSKDVRSSRERLSSRDREGRSSPEKRPAGERRSSYQDRPNSRQDQYYSSRRDHSRERRSSKDYGDSRDRVTSDRRRDSHSERRDDLPSSRREFYSDRRRDANSSSESVRDYRRDGRSASSSKPSHIVKSKSVDLRSADLASSRPSRSSTEVTRSKANREKPQPAPPAPTPRVTSAPHYLATMARPTSEMPSAADMEAMRAREAWELDRLYKGRSMHYEVERDPVPPAPFPMPVSVPFTASHMVQAQVLNTPTGYGSSHTNYTVQTSFPIQTPPSNANKYYSNMPTPSANANQQLYRPQTSYLHGTHTSTPTNNGSSNTIVQETGPSQSTNPLPEPPRASTYKPGTNLPPNDPDFWKQLTAAH